MIIGRDIKGFHVLTINEISQMFPWSYRRFDSVKK